MNRRLLFVITVSASFFAFSSGSSGSKEVPIESYEEKSEESVDDTSDEEVKITEEEKKLFKPRKRGFLSANTCPPDFVELGKKCYYLSNKKASWSGSVKACKAKQAILFEPRSRFLNDLLFSYIHANFPASDSNYWWLGLKEEKQEFVWASDQSIANYTNFDQDKEDEEESEEEDEEEEEESKLNRPQRSLNEKEEHGDQCVVKDHNRNMMWQSESCSSKNYYICQTKKGHYTKKINTESAHYSNDYFIAGLLPEVGKEIQKDQEELPPEEEEPYDEESYDEGQEEVIPPLKLGSITNNQLQDSLVKAQKFVGLLASAAQLLGGLSYRTISASKMRNRSQKSNRVGGSKSTSSGQTEAALKHAMFQGSSDNNTAFFNQLALTSMESVRLLETMHEEKMAKKFRRSKSHKSKLKRIRQMMREFEKMKITNTSLAMTCPKVPKACDPKEKFRQISGYCNNLREPKFGWTMTPFQRILPNEFGDGFNALRLDNNGNELPSARRTSIGTTFIRQKPSADFPSLVMSFGQFIDHDMTQSPIHTKPDGGFFDCCQKFKRGQSLKKSDVIAVQCAPIEVPVDDQFYKDRECINFVRSQSAPRIDCRPGPTEQMNQLTDWLDLSQVYGSKESTADKLRSKQGGKLASSPSKNQNGKELLPLEKKKSNICGESGCFFAGDNRANEQPYLTTLHTVFLREHNRLAEELAKLNPSWDDERLYQEARRIAIAEYQHVIYAEYLPIFLGGIFIRGLRLQPQEGDQFSQGYDPDIDPRITNEFAAAGWRVGHSMVPNQIQTFAVEGSKLTGEFDLRSFFFNTRVMHQPGVVDELIKGMTIQPVETVDNIISEDILNFLFSEDITRGLDLIAFNIQRGRDHGIASYVKYREICQGGKVRSFDDLIPTISRENVDRLRRVYRQVEDIDLYIGMLNERRDEDDAFVARTFRCIIGDQFARLKRGDRFFYENGGQAGSFTPVQLAAIRNVTMARILCDNSDNIQDIQPKAFNLPNSDKNPLTSCKSNLLLFNIPSLNLTPFKDAAAQSGAAPAAPTSKRKDSQLGNKSILSNKAALVVKKVKDRHSRGRGYRGHQHSQPEEDDGVARDYDQDEDE